MKLITEIYQDLEYIKEDTAADGKKNYFIEGIFMQGNIANKNKRFYPISTLSKEMDRYNEEYVKESRAFGELGHPDGPTINLERVSHIIKSLKKEGNDIIGRAKILNTPMGEVVKHIMDEGGKIGVSSRGMGSLREVNGINEVQKDFTLATAADIVADPSAPSAFVEGIMEGVEFYYDTEKKAWLSENVKSIIRKTTTKQLEEQRLKVFKHYLRNL